MSNPRKSPMLKAFDRVLRHFERYPEQWAQKTGSEATLNGKVRRCLLNYISVTNAGKKYGISPGALTHAVERAARDAGLLSAIALNDDAYDHAGFIKRLRKARKELQKAYPAPAEGGSGGMAPNIT